MKMGQKSRNIGVLREGPRLGSLPIGAYAYDRGFTMSLACLRCVVVYPLVDKAHEGAQRLLAAELNAE